MEKLLIAWGFVLLFFCDALLNWGIFQGKRSWENESEWRDRRQRGYGPITRVLILLLAGGSLATLASFTAAAFLDGGLDALRDPNAWLQGRAPKRRAAPPPEPAPAAEASAASPEPTPAAQDAVDDAPEAPEPRDALPEPAPLIERQDLRFWVYEDDDGTAHMVDAVEKIPLPFRDRARALQ